MLMSNTKAWLTANLKCKVGKDENVIKYFVQKYWKARFNQDKLHRNCTFYPNYLEPQD